MAAPKWRGPLLRDAGSDPLKIEHLGRRLDHRSTKLDALRHAETPAARLSPIRPDDRAQNKESL